MDIQRFGASIILTLALSGCVGSTVKSLPNFHEVGIERAEVQPRKDWVEGQRVKVVVSPPEGKEWQEAQQAQLLPLLSRAIERAIEESGSEVIDRSLNSGLRDEMRLAETKGSGNFDGPAVAHFAVKSAFSKVTVSSTRETRGMLSKLINKNDPPVYNHVLMVEGRIRIYEIPSMRLIETLQFEEEQKEDNTSPRLSDANARLHEIFGKAFGSVRSDFKNLIAPRGAVVKKGISDGVTVFQVMIGGEHKVTPRDKVRIFSLAGGAETLIAEGSVTAAVAPRHCWISIDDPQSAAQIREGDLARLVINDGLLGKLKAW
jgi:hypothetical protein